MLKNKQKDSGIISRNLGRLHTLYALDSELRLKRIWSTDPQSLPRLLNTSSATKDALIWGFINSKTFIEY